MTTLEEVGDINAALFGNIDPDPDDIAGAMFDAYIWGDECDP